MILARVRARVVSTARLGNLPPRALLECEPIEGFTGWARSLVAIDSVSAGPGDLVLLLEEGTGAREVLVGDTKATLPAQLVVVGIVDQVETAPS